MPEPSRRWLSRLIGLILGVVIALIGILEDQNKLPDWHFPGFNGLLLIPALYAAIAVHEAGHVALARLVGLDIGGVAVGGFVFFKSGKNWSFRFDWHRWISGFVKPLTKHDSLRPFSYVWMIAGGPLANGVLAAVCGQASIQSGSGAWNWIGTLFWATLFILITSVLPLSSGLSKSDGARLWLLLRHPERGRAWMALLAVQTEEVRGVRPREWDRLMFEQMLTIDAEAGEYPYCQLLAFYRRLDEGSEPAALDHLENALASSLPSGKPFRHILFLVAASASADIRKRSDQARTWRDRACKLRKPESLDAVEAGIAMCEGRYALAAQHWEAARAHVGRRRLDSGLIRFAKERWAEQEALCQAASK